MQGLFWFLFCVVAIVIMVGLFAAVTCIISCDINDEIERLRAKVKCLESEVYAVKTYKYYQKITNDK